MEYQELLDLIDKLDQSSLAYVDFKQADSHVVLSKDVPQAVQPPIHSDGPVFVEQPEDVNTVANQSGPRVEEGDLTSEDEAIVAPMIGVVYLQESPDAKPYVQVGDYVNQGDVVCIIEAMKLMNEIHSPVSGIVTDVLVSNESVVEYNQPLIRVK
ncbi:acetyl-CoA carboxylase biotin carboxyl carrier protein [Aerococcaceae bacterium DSM 111020]|nr:acetyl-CoA carboxylase biotin carboxyl carrier protein [Aerococcaceae bacterium DSM 111020]